MLNQSEPYELINNLELKLEIINNVYHLDSIDIDLLVSYASCFNNHNGYQASLNWLETMNRKFAMDVKEIPLNQIKGWHFDHEMNLRHDSGKFFCIKGVKVSTNSGHIKEWSQPIIHQPEIGILGFLCQKQNGILKFLVQAKMEPGNINKVQFSPTLQATKSNFTQVHKGKQPKYLNYFIDFNPKNIIVDQLQSEQGARFLKKRNRNIIIEVDEKESIKPDDNFIWLSLGELKKLLEHDNLVNMDARSVLSCIKTKLISFERSLQLASYHFDSFHWQLIRSLLDNREPLYTKEEIISWFTHLKTKYELHIEECGLKDLSDWQFGDFSLTHKQRKYFQVIGVEAIAEGREVSRWCQPMIKQYDSGIVGFLIKKINNIYHILVQAKLEVGNFDILEMAPTVQCITGSYKNPEYAVPFLEFFTERKGLIHYDNLQSEEGGRFFKEQNRYMVIEVGDEFDARLEDKYIWMTLRQTKEFIEFNNYFNIEARSLLACLLPI